MVAMVTNVKYEPCAPYMTFKDYPLHLFSPAVHKKPLDFEITYIFHISEMWEMWKMWKCGKRRINVENQ